MLKFQEELILSPYLALYDILVPKDHEFPQLKELDDFQFINEGLKDKYDCTRKNCNFSFTDVQIASA